MTAKKPVIIAVDGPAGSGKSSLCSKVCDILGWDYVNTGFIYRAVGYVARARGLIQADEVALGHIAEELAHNLSWDPRSKEVWLDQMNLTPHLHTVEAGNDASYVAKMATVREKLLSLQRRLTYMSPKGAIVDGRDIGTVVFPDADLKVYLTASLEERARRRLLQLQEKGKDKGVTLEAIKNDIELRDKQDGSRGVAPLSQAEDAVLLDTSRMNVQESVASLIKLIKDKGLLSEF